MAESRRRSRKQEPPASQPELTATHAPHEGLDATLQPQLPADAAGPGGLQPGSEFGRYRIERLLGRGAMGAVYLAQDSALERSVALKVPTVGTADPEITARFQREARSAAVLQHPGICPIHDVGEINGTLYLTMAFIDGRPLSDVTDAKEPVSPRQAAKLIRRLALALAEAHDAGVIHRDLKPANIMLNRRNEPVVMDFGLARWYDGEDRSRLTESGALVGSPADMSPEQVRGEVTQLGTPGREFTVRALHTPGHARGHLCFLHEEFGSMLVGDVVAGEGTVVIDPPEGNMQQYLETLDRVRELAPRTLFPGHGPALADGLGKLREYRQHRRWREELIFKAWCRGVQDPQELLEEVYDDVPTQAHPLARRQIVAHLERLADLGRLPGVVGARAVDA